MEEQKSNKNIDYMVWKASELIEVTTPAELQILGRITDRILRKREERGEKGLKAYLVVDMDKPYADEIKEVLKRHGEL
ncbi:hypothetical protein FDJ58_gp134 [Bacillus phage SIOphi]|uniref:Uncharacterized protein n=1 Tax=Bacillus phage SIOphi TaxID=1285382 RepID=R4JDV2_9CAUD|nr:hypothetical protein FDJ58_gp134 [Bacillus phage SIOphi]AGK86942.1 hypothetical protein SIOphi_00670 [Bacillus phage SIOphi]OLF87160.1 hypothetical protein B4089_3630 [Bacillus licheniformis]OLF87239.1 hypothetical protein B4089_3709 [Bacillus licheniformis]QXN69961.1 hypothetical protein MAWWA_150 [Bacillus phage vB_BspH_Mawwa]